MITLFTTTKDFSGINRSNQLNAIRSWLLSPHKPQVIIFGKSKGYEELGNHTELVFADQVKVTATGAPFGNEMFDAVNRMAKHPVCCYINADILLPEAFFVSVDRAHKALGKEYLLVGERLDVAVEEEMKILEGWEESFLNKYSSSLKLHAPAGSDYFVFPKGQYRYGDMPELYIGRPGWDLWMICNARRKKYKVVDLSGSVRVIHQNHDYSHKPVQYKSVHEDPEVAVNLRTIPQNAKFIYTLLACNYALLPDGSIAASQARGNMEVYAEIEKELAADTSPLSFVPVKESFLRKVYRKLK